MDWTYYRSLLAGDPLAAQPITKYSEIIASPDDSNGNLTFGIELEFLVPSLKKEASDPYPLETRPLFQWTNYSAHDTAVLEALEKACGFRFRLDHNDVFRLPYNSIIRYDMWRLTRDSSVKFGNIDPKEYIWTGREVTSEVMRSDEPRVYTEKITDVCRGIRQLRVHLNKTTSVHVHVGLGDEPFSLITMKKAIGLILLVDDMLMGLHHPGRRESYHCRLVSQCSKLALWEPESSLEAESFLEDALEQGMDEFVPRIHLTEQTLQATTGMEELALLMEGADESGHARGSVAFNRFLPADEIGGNTQTFEFRQMAGCLDPGQIIHWVKVCMAIIDFARLSEAEQYKDLLHKLLVGESTFSAFDLLLELGLVEEETHFRSRVEEYGVNLDYYPGESSGELFVPKLE
ncbi:putative amidoligase enzyme-domain-containing protein [Annulohypoxylon bovei var. microspora]|nr:putative amidoligase enzyme-domain-containing protein [Annulohypoxylon bovei var. microspora]